jgi:galactokinase
MSGATPAPDRYPHTADDVLADRVVEEFRAAFGRDPDGVWAAPGRVNLIGEHVDYNAGRCLPLALPHRTFAAVAARDDDVLRARSPRLPDTAPWEGRLADVAPGGVPGWAGYVAGVPWALRRSGAPVSGFDVVVDSEVPVGSGLSSSAALESSVAVALDDLFGLGLGADDAGRARLAAACVTAENEIAGAPTGGMDQAAALRSSAGHLLALDCRDFSVRQVPLDLDAAGLELLVIDTRARHELVDGQYGSRRDACRDACRLLDVAALADVRPEDLPATLDLLAAAADPERADELLRRVRHVVTEIARVEQSVALLDEGGVHRIGPLLDASHTSLRDDYEVSCRELDLACRAAVEAGALGARMTGGGCGGSAIALVEVGSGDRVARAVDAAFAADGLARPAFLTATPAAAASRVR